MKNILNICSNDNYATWKYFVFSFFARCKFSKFSTATSDKSFFCECGSKIFDNIKTMLSEKMIIMCKKYLYTINSIYIDQSTSPFLSVQSVNISKFPSEKIFQIWKKAKLFFFYFIGEVQFILANKFSIIDINFQRVLKYLFFIYPFFLSKILSLLSLRKLGEKLWASP